LWLPCGLLSSSSLQVTLNHLQLQRLPALPGLLLLLVLLLPLLMQRGMQRRVIIGCSCICIPPRSLRQRCTAILLVFVELTAVLPTAAVAQQRNSDVSSSTACTRGRIRRNVAAGAVQACVCSMAQLPAGAAALHHAVGHAMAWHVAAAAHQRAVGRQVPVLTALQRHTQKPGQQRHMSV
jgi:hypothetical protein